MATPPLPSKAPAATGVLAWMTWLKPMAVGQESGDGLGLIPRGCNGGGRAQAIAWHLPRRGADNGRASVQGLHMGGGWPSC